MKKTVYTTYSDEAEMTFILEDIYDNDECVATEIKGFYYGEPSDELTEEYYGKLKADFR